MNKKIIVAAMVIVLGYSYKIKAMAIPSHSIVIGNKAYSLDYVVKPANFGEINNAISSSPQIYYVVNSTTIKDLFTNEYVSINAVDSIPTITYKDADGDQYIAKSGQDYMEHVTTPFTATAQVQIGSSLNIIKRITVTASSVPDANYFKVGDSNITSVGNPVQTTILQNTSTVNFYADSSGQYLVATGTLDTGTSTGSVSRNISNIQFAMGNSSGNINNMGFVAGDSNNEWVFYRGTGGNLFKVKTDGVDKTQLTNAHDAKYINVVGNYVYYVHSNAATKTTPATTGVYRMKVDGSDAQPIMSGTKQIGTMGNTVFTTINNPTDVIVAGDWIYYINGNDGSLHKINANGYSGDITISSDNYQDINIVKNYLYAVNNSKGNKIYKIDLTAGNGYAASKVSDVEARHLNVVDGEIYYRNYSDNEKLYRMDIDGSNNIKLCDDKVYNLNVCNGVIYYKDGSDANKLYRINCDGTGGQQVVSPPSVNGSKISNDVVENINVIDPTIYFSPANLSSVTSIQKDGTSRAILK